MKKILVTFALLVSLTATAETIAVSKTEAGGEIRLTDEKCKTNEDMLFAYVVAPNGEFFVGCWKPLEGRIFTVYENGKKRMYDPDAFQIVDKFKTKPQKPTI